MKLCIFSIFLLFCSIGCLAIKPDTNQVEKSTRDFTGCEFTQVYPCVWNSQECTWYAGATKFICEGVPRGANMAAHTYTTPQNNDYFDMKILDEQNYELWNDDDDSYSCFNPSCHLQGNSDKKWSGTVPQSSNVYVVINNFNCCSRATVFSTITIQ
mmetsp:Transcript_6321/g.9827  ORF Transcript_6321/g.9827 Transcript_6321/m.9827 type:complete len:156 (+) Transcript_6321:50-517(+)